ncbi:MAG: uracil-DNA glycosylase [Syntrophobacteraceae bacterium]
MEQDKVSGDHSKNGIGDCLEQLRWYLWGLRTAGLGDWQKAGAGSGKREAGRKTEAGSEVAARPAVETVMAEETQPAQTGGDLAEKLSRIHEELKGCTRCRLSKGRTNLVFGEGSSRSRLVFVGEGPGFEEDRQGRPFVGRAGHLLDKMIFAIGLERADVYICNVVKCRPPENRTPQPDEAAACSPFLFRQIEALSPKVICALGLSASQALLQTTRSISELRGKEQRFHGIPLVCTYHPAYLLRSPSRKASAWQDLKEVMRLLKA